jgi:Integrase core domain
MGIRDRRTSFRSPWQNGYVERLIGAIRRECGDHLIVLSERHLWQILANYASYYNDVRTHGSLGKDAPNTRSSGSETSARTRSWAGYTIGVPGSEFSEATGARSPHHAVLANSLFVFKSRCSGSVREYFPLHEDQNV